VDEDGVSEEDLLAQFPEVSPRQLKRWRMEGIFPRPEQIHVEGRRGSASRYPSFAVEQLTAIQAIRENEHRFDEIRFALWWQGSWVEGTALRTTLSALVGEALSPLEELRERYGDPYGVADEVITQMRGSALRNPFVRLMRWNIKGTTYDLETGVYALVLLAFGEEPVWDATDVGSDEEDTSPRLVMERAMGLVRAVHESRSDLGPLSDDPPDAPGFFERLLAAGTLPLANLAEVPGSASLADLNDSRDIARVFVEELGPVAEALEIVIGRDAFGLGVFAVVSRLGTDSALHALLVSWLVLASRAWTDEERGTLAALRDALHDVAPKAREVIALKRRRRS
jgi:hypothetical protein